MLSRVWRTYRSYWSQFPEKEQILREKVDWNVSFFALDLVALQNDPDSRC